MQATIKAPTGFLSLKKAMEVAKAMNENDSEGWKYVVCDCKNGMGRIDVYDEEGEIVVKGFIL